MSNGSHDGTPSRPTLVLLPGLDGTGELFAPFLAVLPPDLKRHVVSYPRHRFLNYDQLLGLIVQSVPASDKLIILGESFSSPLAIRFAAEYPQCVHALILCGGFIRSPLPRWMIGLGCRCIRFLPLNALALRMMLIGWKAPVAVRTMVQRVVKSVDRRVLIHRLRLVRDLDCGGSLERCTSALLYIAGSRDRLVGAEARSKIRRVAEKCAVAVLNAPHMILQTSPQESWDAIQKFLDNPLRFHS